MDERTNTPFDLGMWGPALEKYGAVVQLSVALYGANEQIIWGPLPATPIATLFREHHYGPDMIGECLRKCLAQSVEHRPAVVIAASGLAVVGVSLCHDGQLLGAVVGGYATVSFCDSVAIARLARRCGAPFQELWSLARTQPPIPMCRLTVIGELLQVLGDALLRESDLRQQSEAATERFSHSASHDPLTGLSNRLLFGARLAHALALARRHQRRLAVLFLDLDNFKSINDSVGHMLGDELLRVVAQELTKCVRASDIVSRHGGDEFLVVLAELEHGEDAALGAEKIMAALARPHDLGGHTVHIGVSIGISVYPDDGEDGETLVKTADMALYHAKDQGRAGLQFFRPELNERAVERRSIETGLHRALDQQEFELFYQPKIELRSGTVVGAEALIRWRHPDRGLVGPDQFVGVAEHCGLIKPIGRWVIREVCRQAKEWQNAGLRAIPVSVNISAVEFLSKQFLDHVVDSLKQTQLDPGCLEIELTETVLMKQVEATNSVLYALKTLGVKLAIDDFGKGLSSLSYLTKFPVDALKIDKSFVQEIDSHSYARPIVSAVVNLGKSLNLRVIAEGVETFDQLTFLQAGDCDEGQGYYFSRPLFAQQFATVLQAGTLSI